MLPIYITIVILSGYRFNIFLRLHPAQIIQPYFLLHPRVSGGQFFNLYNSISPLNLPGGQHTSPHSKLIKTFIQQPRIYFTPLRLRWEMKSGKICNGSVMVGDIIKCVTPANAGVQVLCWIPAPRFLEDKFRGDDKCTEHPSVTEKV